MIRGPSGQPPTAPGKKTDTAAGLPGSTAQKAGAARILREDMRATGHFRSIGLRMA